jgi:hypothetical protein
MTEDKVTLSKSDQRRIREIWVDYELGQIDGEDVTRWVDDVWNEARARVGLPPIYSKAEEE